MSVDNTLVNVWITDLTVEATRSRENTSSGIPELTKTTTKSSKVPARSKEDTLT